MPKKILSAGDQVVAKCTKCRDSTNHTIIAMTGDVPAKVECNVCGGRHKFRTETPARKRTVKGADAKGGAKRTSGATQASAASREWASQLEGADESAAAEYSMVESYAVNALIRHPLFGLGLVQRQAGPQKIEVLFESGKKVLRCG